MSYVLQSKEDLEKHVARMEEAHSENLLSWANDAANFFKDGLQILHDGGVTREELVAIGVSVYSQLYAAIDVLEAVQVETRELTDAIKQQREMS